MSKPRSVKREFQHMQRKGSFTSLTTLGERLSHIETVDGYPHPRILNSSLPSKLHSAYKITKSDQRKKAKEISILPYLNQKLFILQLNTHGVFPAEKHDRLDLKG